MKKLFSPLRGRSHSHNSTGKADVPTPTAQSEASLTTMSPSGMTEQTFGGSPDEVFSETSSVRPGDAEETSSVTMSRATTSRRVSLRHLEAPNDGLRMDPEFEAICRNTVAMQRGGLLASVAARQTQYSNADVPGGESAVVTSPSKLLDYFASEGAVYAQYDFSRQQYSGGPLPKPWRACRSQSTGKVYYANTETGATQWEPPLYPLSLDWRVEQSPQSGAVFYVHEATGRWQWERPVDQFFLDLQATGISDTQALIMWKERNEQGDPGFAGLEELPLAKQAIAALPAPKTEEERRLAMFAGLPEELPAKPDGEET